MTRYATLQGAYHIEPMPSQPQLALCHGFFVNHQQRGKGYGHGLKTSQMAQLKIDMYDYAICTIDSTNEAQRRVLTDARWNQLAVFPNSKTGGTNEIWGRVVSKG